VPRIPAAWICGAAGFALLFALAEGFTRLRLVDPTYLPPASKIVAAAVRLPTDGDFLRNLWATTQAWALGLGLAIATAVPLGILLGSRDVVYRATSIVIELLRPIPAVALIPLAIMIYGLGTNMKLFLAVYASVWPILFNAIYGIHDVDPLAKDTARSFGAGRLRILARVSLPSAGPFIFTGIRVAATIALVVIVSAELFAGGSSGLGSWMVETSQSAGDTDKVYAAALIAGVVGVAINGGLQLLERRLFAWQPQYRGRS
jgi:NitT/TauT family transport system permease protein